MTLSVVGRGVQGVRARDRLVEFGRAGTGPGARPAGVELAELGGGGRRAHDRLFGVPTLTLVLGCASSCSASDVVVTLVLVRTVVFTLGVVCTVVVRVTVAADACIEPTGRQRGHTDGRT